MFSYIYNTFFFHPLYNLLVFASAFMPGNSFGLSIIFVSVVAKLIILPLTHQSIKVQKKMKEIEPLVSKIKEDFKNDKEAQAVRTMSLYREHGINPFSSFFLVLLQLPLFIALFYVFKDPIDLASPILYSFTTLPSAIGVNFLGIFELTKASLFLAALVGVTQFIQTWLSVPPLPKTEKGKETSMKHDLAKSMNLQVKYVLPVLIAFIASKLNSAVALFWITNNLFGIGHELFVRWQAKKLV